MRITDDPDQLQEPPDTPRINNWQIWLFLIGAALWFMAAAIWAEYALGHNDLEPCNPEGTQVICQQPTSGN